ncbi:hypothetical protein FZEAL_7853 [Fusarium zealandicum]|uniref:Zn(2)-C6 fungal-type domain-containing protein n=1 Tax=Fusarium zealandicum TaxID=1053134 RepID=A0A8H4XIF5_9HYPO|nr:hypothetical protein FZEAL_7853 [Fusarium zealandicum]
MFTKFDITTPNTLLSDKPTSPQSQPRTKRAQVSRACDWCRLTRVKCDSVRPCRNCKQARRECVNSGRDDFKSIAAATREVQSLRVRVQELETRLMTPSTSSQEHPSGRKRSPRWKGVRQDGVHYGPSSLVYYNHRLSSFAKIDLECNPASTPSSLTPSSPFDCNRLHREQQDALLDLYWQGYHAVYPVLDETDFRRHYESLWDSPLSRKTCPLVDIALALCIQFGSSYTVSSTVALHDQPGYAFYLQAQQSLSEGLEAPSLRTVQCYFLSAIFLLTFDQVNSAYMMVGTAVRMAESLGLQFDDDDEEVPRDESRLAKPGSRLWRCLITLDTQLALHLGRPFAVQDSQVYNPPDPESDHVAQLIGPTYTITAVSDINWLRFQYERQRLFQIVREIHTEFTLVCEEVLEELGCHDFYRDPPSREKCAQYLAQQLKRLKTWVEELPGSLKTQRQQGVPFSVDRSALNLGQNDPLWLQRQRLILELDYHTLVIMLTRSFNSFLPTPALGTLSSDNHCITCANTAVMVTNMLHQVLNDSAILTGWYQVVDWQRNAAFFLAGFACGYPICPMSPSARQTLTRAAEVFETAGSQDMAQLTHSLRTKCLEVVQAFCARLGIVTPATTPADSNRRHTGPDTTDESEVPGSYEVMSLGEEALANIGFDGLSGDQAWMVDPPGGLLWGDLMRDLDSGLAYSLGHVDVNESSNDM